MFCEADMHGWGKEMEAMASRTPRGGCLGCARW
jgi:hypothetical protein